MNRSFAVMVLLAAGLSSTAAAPATHTSLVGGSDIHVWDETVS